MIDKQFSKNFFILYLLGCVIFYCNACSPKVLSFTAKPCTIITASDSVKFFWKIAHGTPVLLFSQEDGNDDENPGKLYLYYKLVVRKGSKEAASTTLALTLLKDTSTDNIVVSTFRHGDSLIGFGKKDTLEWGHSFILHSVAANTKRNMHVQHLNKVAELSADGSTSPYLNGLQNSGDWYISTLLTAAEKKDSSQIPNRLSIKTIIIHQKE